ncbi:MAG: M23 family metallopeptidase [Odoribacteraceae bacterium]|jgi:murein DD-endopeptidase MepM/ murein hydrolase activator NlpD|nr:M23 family metallopeptidase [Odoribacteraceae bacterium]
MAKTGYRFNPKTLSFDKVEITFRKRIGGWLLNLLSGFSMAIVLFVIYHLLFPSPKEESLKSENEGILVQYNLLSDEVDRLDNVLASLKHRDDNLHRVIFEMEPVVHTSRQAETRRMSYREKLRFLNSTELIVNTTRKIDTLLNAIRQQRAAYNEVNALARDNTEMIASIPTTLPVALNTSTIYLAAAYGPCMHPVYKILKFHQGMDFSGPIGAPVRATGNGVVESCGNAKEVGLYIIINHGFEYKSLYAHLEQINVTKGKKVKRGEVIALLGNSGQVSGPHLHYEVHKNGKPVNPINYFFNDLSAGEFDVLEEAANNTGQSMD